MTAYRIIILLLSLAGIIGWAIWIARNKYHWGYSVAPMTYFVHTFILYLFISFGSLSPEVINSWSNAVRIHGLILGVGFAIIFIACGRTPWTIQ